MRLARLFPALLVCSLTLGCANRAARSVSLYEAGDYAGAARAAEEGLARHPSDDGLWQMRIRAALAQGDAPGIATAYAGYRGHRDDDDRPLVRELAIATIGQALASPSVKLKVIAIEAVEAAELHALAELVAERMGDDDDRVAAAAAVAVLRGFPQAPQVASDMLRSEDPEARRIAVDGIGKKVGALAVVDLVRAAADVDPRVRRVAIRWLGQLEATEAVAVLTRRLKDPDEAARAGAANALARIGSGDLAAFARAALADRALAMRLAGVELLVAGKLTPELTAIAERDADPLVAAEAAVALDRKDLAAAALDRAIGDDRWAIRAGVANLARRALGGARGTEVANRLVRDPELKVRLAAARALAHAGDRSTAIPVFAEALAHPELALGAAADLARLGDPRGAARLDEVVRDPQRSSDQRSAAIAAHLTARAITPGLVAALADPSGVVRAEAAAALVTLAN